MKVSRLSPILMLGASMAMGYFITNLLCRGHSETAASATQTLDAFDDTCSATSPDAITCEMPEEISRADFIRLSGERSASETKYREESALPSQ